MEADRRSTYGIERLAFFSDAVFAIAITLLAIDLRLPERIAGYTDATLVDAIRGLMPSLFAFLLSFLVIAAFWIGHLRTFGVVDRADSRLVTLNLAFLAFVALLPLPTSIVAEEGNLPSAAILYAVFVIVAGLLSTLLWVYPARSGLISVPIPPTLARHITYRAVVVPAVFAASIPVALVSPYAAEALWVLALVGQAVVGRRFRLGRRFEHALGAPDEEATRPDLDRDGPPDD